MTRCLILALVLIQLFACGLSAQSNDSLAVFKVQEFLQLVLDEDYAKASAMMVSAKARNLGFVMEKLFQKNNSSTDNINTSKNLNSYEYSNDFGTFISHEVNGVCRSPDGTTGVRVFLKFDKGRQTMLIVLNDSLKINLFEVPHKSPKYYFTPDFVARHQYIESNFFLKSSGYKLPAVFTRPTNRSSYPVVILVAGTALHVDADYSVGPNKFFKDLALGLAAQGVASIRYDHRAYVDFKKFTKRHPTYTAQEDIIDDANAAIKHAMKVKNDEVQGVYVLGHGLGGYVIPRIVDGKQFIKGTVLLSAFARPVHQQFFDTYTFLSNLESKEKKERDSLMPEQTAQMAAMFREFLLKKQAGDSARTAEELQRPEVLIDSSRVAEELKKLETMVSELTNGLAGNHDQEKHEAELVRIAEIRDRIKSLTSADTKKHDLYIEGLPAAYWYDLNEHQPLTLINRLGGRPVLVVHGGRDFQATEEDFSLWKQAFVNHPNAEFKHFPSLNFFMMYGMNPPSPVDFRLFNNVDHRATEAIADWIIQKNQN